MADEILGQFHEFGHRSPVWQKVPELINVDRADPNAKASLLVPHLSAYKGSYPKLVALKFTGQIGSVKILQFVPAPNALVNLHRHGEIVPENPSKRGCGLWPLGDQTRVQQQAFVIRTQSTAQALRTHANQVKKRLRKMVGSRVSDGARFIKYRGVVLLPCAIEQGNESMIKEIEECSGSAV